MPYVCPACAAGALEVAGTLELPPGSWWDEVAVQALTCARCGFRALAVYEESRRGALDSEAVDYRGHRVPAAVAAAFAEGLAACPAPRDPACPCAAHQTWGRTDPSGRWLGVPDSLGVFPLRPA